MQGIEAAQGALIDLDLLQQRRAILSARGEPIEYIRDWPADVRTDGGSGSTAGADEEEGEQEDSVNRRIQRTVMFTTAAAGASPTSQPLVLDEGLLCPSLLYGSWLRLETAATSDGSSESMLLRFTPTSIESVVTFSRLEPHGNAAAPAPKFSRRKRVSHQRWVGSLYVECEWREDSGNDHSASLFGSDSINEASELEHGHLLAAIAEALTMSATSAAASITVGLDSSQGASMDSAHAPSSPWHTSSPAAMTFTLLSMQLHPHTESAFTSGRTLQRTFTTLVECSDQADGSRKHQRAFVRVASGT